MTDRAVITGFGTVGPHGIGREPLAAALAAGRPRVVEVDRSAGYHLEGGSRGAALVPSGDLSRWLPAAQGRRMGMPSRWAVVAARMALAEAGIDSLAGRDATVVLATAFGSVLFTEKLVRQILEEGPESAQPFYFSECVANAPAGQTAIAIGARGANVTITQREAGPLIALARGALEVSEGRAEIAVVGSTDEMTPLLHALLGRYGATASGAGGREETPRPFDLRRDGLLAGEGATVVVLERESAAQERGAAPIARIAATASAFDPTATESDWGDGDGPLAGRLVAALARAGVRPGSIDRIVSGASGSRRGDRLEGLVLREAWGGGALPPVLVPKAVLGEYGGGILAGGVLAASGSPFGRIAAFEAPDPEMMITPHDGAPLDPPRRLLLSSLAAGGAAAWVVLERP
jgi:3-oxoacyl-[acyl-carrier-protein] synthase II